MKSQYILLVLALILVFPSAGFAWQPITRIEVIDRLEEAVRDCDSKTRTLTGAPKGKMLLHKKTMEDALKALKTGREVDPRKLAEALKVHPS